MQRVYLLLRSNQQSGPYSLEELVQFDLKPYDLIWIEGKSAGWYYPQEIQALHPYLSFIRQVPTTKPVTNQPQATSKNTGQTSSKKVFVSMPSNATKEEPTPKPSFNNTTYSQQEVSSQPSFEPRQPEEIKTAYSKSLEEVETDYMNWAYQKKTRKKAGLTGRGALAACLIAGLAFAGWWIMKPYAENPGKTSPEQTAFVSTSQTVSTDSNVNKPVIAPVPVKTEQPKKQKQNQVGTSSHQTTATAKNAQEENKSGENVMISTPSDEIAHVPDPLEKEESSQETVKKQEPVTAEAPKEKKKLRDKIFDLFKKKPEEKKEEAKPVEEENGERRSVHRETGSNLAQLVAIRFTIPNDWMMGIKGAKATLTNRSSETIARATVEVVYYNDDNDLLDKKIISFSNVKSKQTQTVSIPDHATATKLEYNVVSATGNSEPFARR